MGSAVNLLEAFRSVAPPTGVKELDDASSDAQAVLYAELEIQQRKVCASRFDSERARQASADAVPNVLVRLIQAGPRGLREGDPDCDDRVKGYLHLAIYRETLNVLRQTRADHDSLEGDEGVKEPAGPDVAPAPFEEEAAELADQGRELLRGKVLAAAIERAARRDVRESLKRDFAELDGIRAAPDRFAELVASAAGSEPGSPAWRTAANKLYQRYGRCLERLDRARRALHEDGTLDSSRALAVEYALDELRLNATASERTPAAEEAPGDDGE